MSKDFPNVDPNRLINKAAVQLLNDLSPAAWIITSEDGSDDFGLDFKVQLAIDSGIRHIFYIQLKGVEQLSVVNNHSQIAQTLKRTTLNLYSSMSSEVMLVVANVNLDSNGKLISERSTAYWCWMSPVLEKLRGGVGVVDSSDTQTSTVHIPIHQKLSPDTDVSSYLDRLKSTSVSGLSLDAIIRAAYPNAIDNNASALTQLFSLVQKNPKTLNHFFQQETEAKSENIPQSAIEIRSLLNASNTDQAEHELNRLGVNGFGDLPVQIAEYLIIKGRIHNQRYRPNEALECFKNASKANPSIENLLIETEARFLIAFDENNTSEMQALLYSIEGIENETATLIKLRINIALGESEAAEAQLSKINGNKRKIASLILHSSKIDFKQVSLIASDIEGDSTFTRNEVVSAQIIAARTAWNAATIGLSTPHLNKNELPLHGALGTDIQKTQEAWTWGLKALKGLRSAGWPTNINLISSAICGIAGVLGKQDEVLCILDEAVKLRPEFDELQNNYELLAIGIRKIRLAIEANLRQKESIEVLTRRTPMLWELKRYAEAADVALQLDKFKHHDNAHLPMAFAIGHAAAYRVGRHVDAKKLLANLEYRPIWSEYIYFAQYVKLSASKSSEADILYALRDGLRHNPTSGLLASNLFTNLDISDANNAREAIKLSKILKKRSLLNADEICQLIRAHTTLEEWDSAASEATRGIERFASDERLFTSGAVAQEMLGNTGIALNWLEKALELGSSGVHVFHNCMSLALRLGRIDSVRNAISNLFGLVSANKDRVELLRISALIYAQQGQMAEALATAEELGEMVDANDEEQEGLFLNLFMAITTFGSIDGLSFKINFSNRVTAFGTKWPESLIFRRYSLPINENADGKDVVKAFESILGGSFEERIRSFSERENLLKNGLFNCPYILRPDFVLHWIGDPFTLWEHTKKSQATDKHLHLRITRSNSEPLKQSPNPQRDIPLIDLSSLILLDSLDLFDKLFSYFQEVAIPRITVSYISQHSVNIFIPEKSRKIAASLLASINNWINRIHQPSTSNAVKLFASRDSFNEYSKLLKSSKYLAYCDDEFTCSIIADDSIESRFINTLQFLKHLDGDNVISSFEVSQCLVKLSAWNVALQVEDRYLIASLTGAAIPKLTDTDNDRLNAFSNHQPFLILARALWDPGKKAELLVLHMGYLLISMLQNIESDQRSIVAVYSFWLNRCLLSPKTQGLEDKLICYPTLLALPHLSDDRAIKAISILFDTFRLTTDERKMSTTAEVKLARILGETLAASSSKNFNGVQVVLNKILKAILPGTQLGDSFLNGFNGSINNDVIKK